MKAQSFVVERGTKVNAALVAALQDASTLIINPKNTRAHNARSLEIVRRSLERFGFQSPIVYDAETRIVIAGNGRLQAARDGLGWAFVPAVPFAGTRAQIEAFAVVDNRSAELSEWDWGNVAAIAETIRGGGFDFDELGFLDHEISMPLSADWTPDAPDGEAQESSTGGGAFSIKFAVGEQSDIVRAAIGLRRTNDKQTDAEVLVNLCRRVASEERGE